jgi:DNA gyrase/topoisomerase IV subunit B
MLDSDRFGAVHPAAFAELIDQGLVAVINVMLRDPRFGTPSREQLANPEVQHAVAPLVSQELHRRLVADPALCERLLARMPPAPERRP